MSAEAVTVFLRAEGTDPQFPTRGPLIGQATLAGATYPKLIRTPDGSLFLLAQRVSELGGTVTAEYIQVIPVDTVAPAPTP